MNLLRLVAHRSRLKEKHRLRHRPATEFLFPASMALYQTLKAFGQIIQIPFILPLHRRSRATTAIEKQLKQG